MTQEQKSFFQSLDAEKQTLLREWSKLFSLSHNPPPPTTKIGTVIMPTGDCLDRLRPGLEFFGSRYDAQEVKPKLVITGANSFNVIPRRCLCSKNRETPTKTCIA